MPITDHVDSSLLGNVRLFAKVGREDELARRLGELAMASVREPGNQRYKVFRSRGQPALFYIQESWRDQEALDKHFRQSHFKTFAADSEEILAEPFLVGFGNTIHERGA